MPNKVARLDAEWLEADGLGGFASGTVGGIRTRRYHALLMPATAPPAGRVVLVNGFDAWIETAEESFALSSQRYAPDVVHPDGAARLVEFASEPWPKWSWWLSDDLAIEHELFAMHSNGAVSLSWREVSRSDDGREPRPLLVLRVRLFLSGRDFHSMHHENGAFRFDPEESPGQVAWRPYEGVPTIVARHNGNYTHEPCWYRNFLYVEEQARGLDCTEDCASPGVFEWNLTKGPAEMVLTTREGLRPAAQSADPARLLELKRRSAFPTPLHRAADAYLVKRGTGRTIIAGYPWFGDWGRDTFIALRGLCLATGRLDDAREILVEWAGAVSEGMLPNRFPDRGETSEFNSVDASLWYVIAVADYLRAAPSTCNGDRLKEAVEQILTGYSVGTRFGIRRDADGLLACGVPGVQLTWMDAKVGDWFVTPRIGKPVEVQALWLNALHIAAAWSPRWSEFFEKGHASFLRRFPNGDGLFDVVDCDHEAGKDDASIRPNQIFAVGGLPVSLIKGEQARRLVDLVERRLLTPLGLRSLAPGEPGYTLRYEGGVLQRDGSYHQGTVWPWLIGPFVEAWLRVRGETPLAKAKGRERFLVPLHAHLHTAGLGHVSEIADADHPHTPRGCPFQAWSVGELLHIESLLGVSAACRPSSTTAAGSRRSLIQT